MSSCLFKLNSINTNITISGRIWLISIHIHDPALVLTVTGRHCPHSGVGGDFLARQTNPLMKTAVARNGPKWPNSGPEGFGARAVSCKTPIDLLYLNLPFIASFTRPSSWGKENGKMQNTKCERMQICEYAGDCYSKLCRAHIWKFSLELSFAFPF